jgi:hypothetical protein
MRLLMSVTIALAIAVTPNLSNAQGTIGLYGDTGSGLFRFIDTGAVQFDIIALTDIVEPSCAIEFIMTELTVLFPGVLKTSTVKVNNTPLDLGDNAIGEYLLAYMECMDPGPLEVVRVTYLDLDGAITLNDVVLSLRGYGPGDSRPSSFNGDMGYIDPLDGKHVLTSEPWSEFGMSNTTELAGAVVLNPTWLPVPSGVASMSALKARF